jgi:ubiquinone/menaquinone biosynthesis C-methylase UbiE
MPYSRAEAQKEFDRWSGGYDRNPLQLFFFEPAHRMLLDALGPDDRCILDVGCGTGRFASRVLERFPRSRVWGLDLSEGMLRRGQARCRAADGRLHLVRADSARLPFASSTFDVVTCAHSFHHYPHQARVLSEMHRVLRPGGRLLIIDGDRDRWWGRFVFDVFVVLLEGAVHHVSRRGYRALLREAGFDVLMQRRRRGPFPFLFSVGRAVKPASGRPLRRIA